MADKHNYSRSEPLFKVGLRRGVELMEEERPGQDRGGGEAAVEFSATDIESIVS